MFLTTILTTRSSGKKYVIEQTILHNLLKSDSCRENVYKFTKILLKSLQITAHKSPLTNDFEKRNIN